MDSTNGVRKSTVLIVDDTPANVSVLADDLLAHGYAVMVAQEGEEAIRRARLGQPDIIMLDIMMPGIDGFEVCRRLKADAVTKDIPVIFMTALSDTSDKITGFELGGVDYVTKPFQTAEVLARINTHLALQTMRRQLADQNRQLQHEIAVRQQAEAALQRARDELEERVAQRTADLAGAYAKLQAELIERNRTEAALREREARIRRLMESNIIGVLFFTVAGAITAANDAFLAMVGYSREDLQAGKLRWRDMTPDEYKAGDDRSIEELLAKGSCLPFEKEYARKDGSRVPVLLARAMFEGSCEEGVAFVVDLSERKEAEQALSESRARLAAILDSALDAIITVDADQRIILFNTAAERMFGWPAREVIGGSLDRLLPERFRDRHGQHIHRFAESGVSQRAMGQGLLEVVGLRANGEEFPVDASISRAESAGQTLFTVMLRDITERKRAEAERQARLEAEAASRAKTDLLANMSHELRSPLNTILGFTRLLTLEPVLPDSIREDLGLILKSGEHLHALINDVLDMTKLEAGRMEVNEASFDLDFLLDEVKDMLTPMAVEKGLQLNFPPHPGVPAYVRADPLKLRQILLNLIGNSIKFTQQGEITVKVEATPPDPESATTRLRFSITDTGVGIAPDEVPHLFTAFSQAKAGRQAQEGTGLGLAISRRFVELMGGEMQLESQLGQGTTVRFDIPAHPIEAPAFPGEAPGRRRVVGLVPGQRRYRLLAVDDHAEARQLLVRLLGPLGFEFKEAGNGQEAIRVWREWHPDLIWMDMRMPILDGRDAARRIRTMAQDPRPVIIALTASAFEEERMDVLAAGCDDLVRKPFRPFELFAVLEKHLGVRFVYEEEPPSLPPQLGKEAFAALPDNLRSRLEQALVELDAKAIERVIDTIHGQDPQLADGLAQAAANFQYDRILSLLHSLTSEKPEEPKG